MGGYVYELIGGIVKWMELFRWGFWRVGCFMEPHVPNIKLIKNKTQYQPDELTNYCFLCLQLAYSSN